MAYSDDYKITIFDLLERKKIRELNIKCNTYIKYFINQNNFKEYLLLGDPTELLDINNNYNIIYTKIMRILIIIAKNIQCFFLKIQMMNI